MVEYKKKSMPKELLDLFGDSSYVNFESIINPPKYLKDRLEKEINKRDNSEDLRKKIIITKNEIYFILNVLTDEEYNKLVEMKFTENMKPNICVVSVSFEKIKEKTKYNNRNQVKSIKTVYRDHIRIFKSYIMFNKKPIGKKIHFCQSLMLSLYCYE